MTARTAADLLGIQANTAALFYHKIRLVIEHHLALEAHEIFDEKLKLMIAILEVIEKENADEVRLEKWLYSVY